MSDPKSRLVTYIEAVRAAYLSRFEAELARDGGTKLASEGSMSPTAAAADLLPRRFDVAWITAAGEPEVVHLGGPHTIAWEPTHIRLKGTFVVTIGYFEWSRCALMLRPPPTGANNTQPILDWFVRWFDDTARPRPEGPFRGVIHSMVISQVDDKALMLELDLGTAPIVALFELLDLLAACGATDGALLTEDDAEPN